MSTPGHALEMARKGWALDTAQLAELVALIDKLEGQIIQCRESLNRECCGEYVGGHTSDKDCPRANARKILEPTP